MNIAIFSDCYTPQINGVVTVIRTLKTELEKQGHKVYIFTVKHPKAVEEENIFRIRSFRFPNEPQHRIGYFLARKTIKKVRSLKIDLIHSHTEFSLYLLSRKVCNKLNIPSVHTIHTYYRDYLDYLPFLMKIFFKNYLNPYMRRILRKQKCVVAPSLKIKYFLDDILLDPPAHIVPNGIDLSIFYENSESIKKDALLLRKKYNIADDDNLIVFVGRLGGEKNIGTLLENFKKISLQKSNTKMLLVGDGPDKKALQERCHELGLTEKVIFTGYLRWPDEIRLVYKASNMFMSASHSEVHPITFIEAMASGLPVVAAADPSITGMVVDGENGWAVNDDKLMWEKALEILNNKDDMIRMGKRSDEISRTYSVENFIKNMLKVYEQYRRQ